MKVINGRFLFIVSLVGFAYSLFAQQAYGVCTIKSARREYSVTVQNPPILYWQWYIKTARCLGKNARNFEYRGIKFRITWDPMWYTGERNACTLVASYREGNWVRRDRITIRADSIYNESIVRHEFVHYFMDHISGVKNNRPLLMFQLCSLGSFEYEHDRATNPDNFE